MTEELRLPLGRRLGTGAWIAVDCGAGVLLAALAGEGAAGGKPSGVLAGPVAVFGMLAVGLLLGMRRLWPRAVLALLLTGMVLQALLSPAEHWAISFGLAFVLYVVAARTPRRQAVLALVGSVLVWTVAEYVVAHRPAGAGGLAGIMPVLSATSAGDLVLAAGWMIGLAARQQRAYDKGLRRQAERHAEERITEERLRIARELHDIVAHSMSLIAVQAGVANYVVAEHPEAAVRALGSIEQTSRGALDEMRRMLGVLRSADGVPEDPELGPGPRLADLGRLAAATTEAGVAVRLRRDGEHRELTPGIELAGYRIVQEALSNVVKHAAARSATVLTGFRTDELLIEIVDDGVGGTPPTGKGHGLAGMRERVACFGGEFTAGPAADGGFRVAATIPLPHPLPPSHQQKEQQEPAADLVAP